MYGRGHIIDDLTNAYEEIQFSAFEWWVEYGSKEATVVVSGHIQQLPEGSTSDLAVGQRCTFHLTNPAPAYKAYYRRTEQRLLVCSAVHNALLEQKLKTTKEHVLQKVRGYWEGCVCFVSL